MLLCILHGMPLTLGNALFFSLPKATDILSSIRWTVHCKRGLILKSGYMHWATASFSLQMSPQLFFYQHKQVFLELVHIWQPELSIVQYTKCLLHYRLPKLQVFTKLQLVPHTPQTTWAYASFTLPHLTTLLCSGQKWSTETKVHMCREVWINGLFSTTVYISSCSIPSIFFRRTLKPLVVV